MTKIKQKEVIFYLLYKKFKTDPGEYMPVWSFMGEHLIEPLEKHGFVSHECSARMSDLRRENPNLFEYKEVTGPSGAKYYTHRIRPDATPDCIVSHELRVFYNKLKVAERYKHLREIAYSKKP